MLNARYGASKNEAQVTQETTATVEEWARYIKALCLQETKLTQLAHLPKGTRIEVLKKLGAKSAEEVFEVTKEC